MNTCTPHPSGAFMLELAGLSPMQHLEAQRQDGNRDTAAGMQRGCDQPWPCVVCFHPWLLARGT